MKCTPFIGCNCVIIGEKNYKKSDGSWKTAYIGPNWYALIGPRVRLQRITAKDHFPQVLSKDDLQDHPEEARRSSDIHDVRRRAALGRTPELLANYSVLRDPPGLRYTKIFRAVYPMYLYCHVPNIIT